MASESFFSLKPLFSSAWPLSLNSDLISVGASLPAYTWIDFGPCFLQVIQESGAMHLDISPIKSLSHLYQQLLLPEISKRSGKPLEHVRTRSQLRVISWKQWLLLPAIFRKSEQIRKSHSKSEQKRPLASVFPSAICKCKISGKQKEEEAELASRVKTAVRMEHLIIAGTKHSGQWGIE